MFRYIKSILSIVTLVILGSTASAQIQVNGIELLDASQMVTGEDIVSQPNASVLLRNDFGVDVIISIKDSSGTIVAEVTVPANSAMNVDHGQSTGKYAICAKAAGSNESTEIGMLCVATSSGGSTGQTGGI